MKENYKRTVTHTSYKHGNKKVKKGGISRMIPLRITHKEKAILRKEIADDDDIIISVSDKYMELPTASNVVIYMGGGAFLLAILGFLGIIYKKSGQVSTNFYFFILPFVLGFLFFVYYYITIPQKECIFNREDGLVTFPGFMWYKNITMPIRKILFSKSSPSTQGVGAGWLEIIRPDKTYSLYSCTFGNMYYEDLSFLLWYMDKNRPLPPGDAFDEFRQADFERRKSEGFPKPLFKSDFKTPEATKEQQKERKKIGGW